LVLGARWSNHAYFTSRSGTPNKSATPQPTPPPTPPLAAAPESSDGGGAEAAAAAAAAAEDGEAQAAYEEEVNAEAWLALRLCPWCPGDPPRLIGEPPFGRPYLNRSLCRQVALPLPRHASLTSFADTPSLAAHSAPLRYSSSTSPVAASNRSTGLKPPAPAPGLPPWPGLPLWRPPYGLPLRSGLAARAEGASTVAA
jgi:hypothetical protein